MPKTPKPKYLRGLRKCIFCGGGNLSREHIWPVWASSLLPDSDGHTIARSTDENDPKPVRQGQGSIKKQRLRVVCQSCNSGWMGTLEARVRPILSPLILGQKAILGKAEQHVLAEWVAMKVMVLEHSYPPDVVVTQKDRHALMAQQTIPAGMKMFIAMCGKGGWETATYRVAVTASLTPKPTTSSRRKNVQCTTFGIGKALIHTAVSALDDFDLDDFVGVNDAIFRLWPYSGRVLLWPCATVSADAAMTLACRIDPLINSPRSHRLPSVYGTSTR